MDRVISPATREGWLIIACSAIDFNSCSSATWGSGDFMSQFRVEFSLQIAFVPDPGIAAKG